MTRWIRTLLMPLLALAPCQAFANDLYTHGGFPATGSIASSASMRAEFDSITTGFDKFPAFSGNGSKAVIINSGATAFGVTTGTLGLAGNFAIVGAFSTTLTVTNTTTLTLPVTGTLATLAGSETLTTKTINLANNTLTGTTAQFNTALSDNDFATLAGAESLSNKTLPSPVISGTVSGSATYSTPTIATPTFSGTASGTLTNLVLTTPTLNTTAATSGLTMNTARLLGRTTGSSGAIEELTVGGSLTLSAGSLSGTASSTTQAGVVELATQAEVDTMTDTVRAVTPNHNKLILGSYPSASGTAVDFTSIPAGVRRITIMFNSVSTNGTNDYRVQLGDAGGIEATGYLGAGTSMVNGSSPGVGNETTGFLVVNGAAAAGLHHGSIVLTLLDSTSFTWACHSIVARSDTTQMFISTGIKPLSQELDRVRVTAGGNTFDSGSINILYER